MDIFFSVNQLPEEEKCKHYKLFRVNAAPAAGKAKQFDQYDHIVGAALQQQPNGSFCCSR